MNRAPLTTLIWIVLLLACAVGLTIASFRAAILPEHRGTAFDTVVATTCAAEFIFAAGLYYLLAVPHTVRRPSPAVRIRVLVLMVVWFFLLLTAGVIAVAPANTGTRFSENILLIQAIPTFLLLVAVYFFNRQDVLLQVRQEVPQEGRIDLQLHAGRLDAMIESIRAISQRRPQQAAELDRLQKRLDTLKTQLVSVSPVAQREPGRSMEPIPAEQIQEQLKQLSDKLNQLTAANDEQFEARLAALRQTVDAAVALLRRHEEVVSF
jgi:hypothetical protein